MLLTKRRENVTIASSHSITLDFIKPRLRVVPPKSFFAIGLVWDMFISFEGCLDATFMVLTFYASGSNPEYDASYYWDKQILQPYNPARAWPLYWVAGESPRKSSSRNAPKLRIQNYASTSIRSRHYLNGPLPICNLPGTQTNEQPHWIRGQSRQHL